MSIMAFILCVSIGYVKTAFDYFKIILTIESFSHGLVVQASSQCLT